jgi:6-phosphogluconolactonase
MSEVPAVLPERRFENADALYVALAGEVAARLTGRVASDGRASLVATGGTTPGPVYDRLSAMEVPWAQVDVTLTDERWVPTDSDASNEALVRSRLLTGRGAAAKLVGFKTPDASPAGAVRAVDAAIAAMTRPFEAMVLGMGDDGHIASLFPQAPELAAAMDTTAFVCAVDRQGAAGADARLSMTRRALLDTRWIALLMQGDEKLEVYRRALTPGDIADLPVRMLLHQIQTPVQLWWAP